MHSSFTGVWLPHSDAFLSRPRIWRQQTPALQKLHTAEAWTPQLEHYSAADEVAIVDFPKQALMLSNTYHVIDAQTGDGFIGVFWDDLVLGHTRVSRAVKHQH